MIDDETMRAMHHDLRAVLSAVQMNLQTLEALEAEDVEISAAKRLTIIARAKEALREAVGVVDRLRPGTDDEGDGGG